jgi:primosomal protein N' (replication factor Y) (superfamily II helicase)
MPYAKVVLGLAVEGPFDYSIPAHLAGKIKEGMRVWVPFINYKKLGYVVKVTLTTNIERVKPILEAIDSSAVLNKEMLLLTKELSDYYGCSWGEAIETALPDALRKGKKITDIISTGGGSKVKDNHEVILLHDLSGASRWDVYLNSIKEAAGNKESVILLFPDTGLALKAQELISAELGVKPQLLYRKQPGELEEWLKAGGPEFNIAVGTRSCIFAPVKNLGLIIVDEEQESVYKQEQVPHYHARDVALMRASVENARLILGSSSPSLEAFYLCKKGRAEYRLLPRDSNFPDVKVVDMYREWRYLKANDTILSKYLQDCMMQVMEVKGKVLLFLNRKGFSTLASCRNCGKAMKCERCNVNLVYHFKDNTLNCRYCNFKMIPPKICPFCDAAYIKYSGTGTEKIESDIARFFPMARVNSLDGSSDVDIASADIFISTASVIKKTNYNFDLIGDLSVDNSLNRVDFRAAEKAFGLLSGLVKLTDKKIILQTNLPRHYSLRAIADNNPQEFYDQELKQRKELDFPPYRHICLVKLRGRKEPAVKDAAFALFEKLSNASKGERSVRDILVNPGQPDKLRGNYYWQVLIKGSLPVKMIKFIKLHLKSFRHSGIIVTIDMDPA